MNNKAVEKHMPTRQVRRDAVENRRRILATARQLFAAQGVEATSMNQIAQTAGVGPGTLYRNYKHKGTLCLALLEDDLKAFEERIASLIEGTEAPESALMRLKLLLDELLLMTESHIPLLAGVQEACAGIPHDVPFTTPFYSKSHTRITQLLNEAIENEETDLLDAVFTADTILAAISPPLFLFQQQHRGFDRARIAAGIHRLFIDGLRIEKSEQ